MNPEWVSDGEPMNITRPTGLEFVPASGAT